MLCRKETIWSFILVIFREERFKWLIVLPVTVIFSNFLQYAETPCDHNRRDNIFEIPANKCERRLQTRIAYIVHENISTNRDKPKGVEKIKDDIIKHMHAIDKNKVKCSALPQQIWECQMRRLLVKFKRVSEINPL